MDRTVTRTEQGVRTERTEQAVLDIRYQDLDGRRWVDVSVRHPGAGNASEVSAAAGRDGEAARRGERAKHTRYPGDRLTAFVVESSGRVGGEARRGLLRHCCDLPEDLRTAERSRAYKVVSCCVQAQVARQLREAAGLK